MPLWCGSQRPRHLEDSLSSAGTLPSGRQVLDWICSTDRGSGSERSACKPNGGLVNRLRGSLVTAAMVVLGAHAPAGALEWTQYVATRPTIPGGCYGTAVVGIGDVNSDGCEDYAVANPARCASQGAQMYPRGSVEIRSGADGSILVELVAPNGAETFGRTIAKIGDVDDDGVPDIAIGEPGADVGTQSEAGVVHVYPRDRGEAEAPRGRRPARSPASRARRGGSRASP
jgi:hypothetical protein